MGFARVPTPMGSLDKPIDLCENCLFNLVHTNLNPALYTMQFRTKEKFNEMVWKLKREESSS